MATKEQLAAAIARFEGWLVPGTIARRNNNPGNLRSGKGQIGTDSNGYAIFPNEQTGWDALYRQIDLDTSRGLTLQSFIAKYAPPSENATQGYLNFLVRELGVSADTPLSVITGGGPNPIPPHSHKVNRG